jgi:iron-sulfur cluster assembly accessory protein
MKSTAICLIALSAMGCDKPLPSIPARIENPASSSKASSVKPFTFAVSQIASEKLNQAMAARPDKTYVMVSVDIDDKKYCTGFHYKLEMSADASSPPSILLESNGINLAIDKQASEFLTGTTLDWGTLESGESGFVFRNPNENKSLPDGLR